MVRKTTVAAGLILFSKPIRIRNAVEGVIKKAVPKIATHALPVRVIGGKNPALVQVVITAVIP